MDFPHVPFGERAALYERPVFAACFYYHVLLVSSRSSITLPEGPRFRENSLLSPLEEREREKKEMNRIEEAAFQRRMRSSELCGPLRFACTRLCLHCRPS